MAQSFTWVPWDVNSRGVRPEARVHVNQIISKRMKARRVSVGATARASGHSHSREHEKTTQTSDVCEKLDASVETWTANNVSGKLSASSVYRSLKPVKPYKKSFISTPPLQASERLYRTPSTRDLNEDVLPHGSPWYPSYFPRPSLTAPTPDMLRQLSEAQIDTQAPEVQETRLIAHNNFGRTLNEFSKDDSSREADLSISRPFLAETMTNAAKNFELSGNAEDSSIANAVQHAQALQDSLTSFRRDSLSVLPVDLANCQDLLDYWIAEFPRIMQIGDNPSIERMFSPNLKVFFNAAMSGPWAFESIVLLWALYHRSRVHGISDGKQFARIRPRVTRRALEVTEPRNWTGKDFEQTAILVIIFCNAEYLYGDKTIGFHFHDRARAWFRRWRVECNQWTSWQTSKFKAIFWWDRALKPEIRNYIGYSENALVFKELEGDFDTFWNLMQDIRELAVEHSLMTSTMQQAVRRITFKSGSFFHSLLQLRVTPGDRLQHRRQALAQFLVLCFIHVALLELKDSVTVAEAYIADLLRVAVENDFEADAFPIQSMLWSFQTCPLLSRAGTVAHISASSQIAVRFNDLGFSVLNGVLLSYLALDQDSTGTVNLPSLQKALFYGMVFEPNNWKFTESIDPKMSVDVGMVS